MKPMNMNPDLSDIALLGYENTRLVHYNDLGPLLEKEVAYEDLPELEIKGVLKCNRLVDGKLRQIYTDEGSHVGVIAGTRLGKTSSYVIPLVRSFGRQKQKKSMFISDPKGELYRTTADALRKDGYDVRVVNFRDAHHSEGWNPLTKIFRAYQSAFSLSKEVRWTRGGRFPVKFREGVYNSNAQLERALARTKSDILYDVEEAISELAGMVIPTLNMRDPYWEQAACLTLQAFLWAMLEDSHDDTRVKSSECEWTKITEDTYSFDTIFSILATFDNSKHNFDDHGYFSEREATSHAYKRAKDNFLENAQSTRQNIFCIFNTKMAPFLESSVRTVTCCNTFELAELVERPTVLFINYKDEVESHYRIINLFVQDIYRALSEIAGKTKRGALDRPFYFILDEFGNFPMIEGFNRLISVSAGRAIYFVLILQSYAQLEAVYDPKTAEVILDNLNVKIMLGSNNAATLAKFSEECGDYARISPISALSGGSADIEQYQIETLRRIPRSMLSHFDPGECVIREANCNYVLWSRLERYYLAPELSDYVYENESNYKSVADPYDDRFVYKLPKMKRKRPPFEDF